MGQQAIADERIRSAPACDPLNAASLAFLQNVPDHEEILLVAYLSDDRQFFLNLRQHLALTARIPLP